MSNWYGAARTNYVEVEDIEKLQQALEQFDVEIVKATDEVTKKELVAFFPGEDSNDFQYSTEDDDGNDITFDWGDNVLPFIKEREVLVVMCSGAEKLRYVTGDTQAYVRKGTEVSSTYISLNDIYEKASKEFDIPVESITHAEY